MWLIKGIIKNKLIHQVIRSGYYKKEQKKEDTGITFV